MAICSARAKALGITPGVSLAEATALAGPSKLHSEGYDPAADREALKEWAEWCRRFSPLVGLDAVAAPDCLLLDVTGLAHLFGGETALAAKVIHDFAHRGLVVRVAIADTIGAAWALAHFPANDQEIQNTPSTPHSPLPTHHSPNIPPGEVSPALHPLPVEALRLPDDVVDLLHQLGVYRIGQLESLPRSDLTARFGPRLLERWDQATGRLAEPIPAQPLTPEFGARWLLDHPTTRRETIEHVVEQLVGRVAQMLFRCGRGALRLECRLDCQSARGVEISVGLFQPSAAAGHLFGLIHMPLERARLPAPVEAVDVRAAVTAALERRQQELFSDGPPGGHARHLAGLVDRLSSRLGRRSAMRARLVVDAQPERAYRYVPLVEGLSGRRSRRGTSSRTGESDLPPRPLRLLRQPMPLAAVSIMPDGPPLRFHLRYQEHRIAQSWGPERIETGWWRGRPVRRDYYRIETTTGRRYWLFRDLGNGRWFLHGTFE